MPATQTSIPPASQHPGVAPLYEQHVRTQARLNELESRANEIELLLLSSRDRTGSQDDAAAEAYLDGAGDRATSVKPLRGELAEIRAEIKVARKAVTIAKRRRDEAINKASIAVAESLLQTHRDLVGEIARRAVALAGACDAEREFRRRFEEAGYFISHLEAMPFRHGPGDRRESEAYIRKYLARAVELGALTTREADALLAA